MPSASSCQSWAERSQSHSAVHVIVVCQPWARESLGEEEKGKKKGNGPTVGFDFQIKKVTVGLSSL